MSIIVESIVAVLILERIMTRFINCIAAEPVVQFTFRNRFLATRLRINIKIRRKKPERGEYELRIHSLFFQVQRPIFLVEQIRQNCNSVAKKNDG